MQRFNNFTNRIFDAMRVFVLSAMAILICMTPSFCPAAASDGVMMQFFHWYYPTGGLLWEEAASRAEDLAKAGITALWLPPAYKGASADDVGYGVYDLYIWASSVRREPSGPNTAPGISF